MRIERIEIAGFGCLHGVVLDFPADRLSLVVDRNDAGKTTLAKAILHGIYGFPRRQRSTTRGGPSESGRLREVDVCRPSGGEPFGLTLTVRTQKGTIHIERDFHRDTFTVRDADTGRDLTHGLRQIGGEAELHRRLVGGLSRDEFLATLFVRQAELAWGQSGDVPRSGLIQRLIDTGGGESDAQRATELLNQALQHYPTDKGRQGFLALDTELKRRDADIEEYDRRLAAMDLDWNQAQEGNDALEAARREVAEHQAHILRWDHLAAKAELVSCETAVREREDLARNLQQARIERERLSHRRDYPADLADEVQSQFTRCNDAVTAQKEAEGRRVQAEANRTALEATPDFRRLRPLDSLPEGYSTTLALARQNLEAAHSTLGQARAQREDWELERGDFEREAYNRLRERFRPLSQTERDILGGGPGGYNREWRRLQSELSEVDAKRKKPALGAGIAGILLVLAGLWATHPPVAALGSILILAAAGWYWVSPQRRRLIDAHKTLEKRAQAVADEVGYESIEDASDGFGKLGQWDGRARKLSELDGQVVKAEPDAANARQEAADLLREAGREAGATNVTLELLDKLARDLQDWLILKPTWRSRKDAEEKALGQLKDERRKRDEAQERLRHLCKQAGLDASGSPAELRGRFLEAKGEYDTWRQLTRETIPELERRLLKLDRKALEDRKQRLTDSLKKQQAADPVLANLRADRTAEHYREEGRRAHRAVEEARKKVRQVESQLQALLAGPLRGREEVKEAKARAQHKLDQAHHFQAAIERAREVLEDVAEHSHRAWAKKLNDRAGKLIGSLCPALTELRFDEGLNLTAQDAGGRRLDQRQVDQQLNTGARDQLYLAARLAIAEELSGGDEALPLILDDPLVSSDDVRFTRGMRHLAETLASSQQVIVLTCHEGRHARLREQDPGWYDARIAELRLSDALQPEPQRLV